MNDHDYLLLERYASVIFGCHFDDLSESEETLLIAYVREKETSFENRRGIND